MPSRHISILFSFRENIWSQQKMSDALMLRNFARPRHRRKNIKR